MEAATFAKSIMRPRPAGADLKTAGRVWPNPCTEPRVWIARSWSWTPTRRPCGPWPFAHRLQGPVRCAATEDIRESFGLGNALDYLIGEKLFTFLMASEQDPEFAAEVPPFVDEIRRIFTPEETRTYLDEFERTKFLAPPDPAMETEDPWRPDRRGALARKPRDGRSRTAQVLT